MKRIIVDHENNAESFWEGCWAAANLPYGIERMLNGRDSVTVSDAEANDILAWAQKQQGWNGGPEYAPHPLLIQDA